MTTARPVVDVEVWSDVICPWCYIGKRRFERAVAEVAGEVDVRVTYRPYQLDPSASATAPIPAVEGYARKFGGPEQATAIIAKVTSVAAEDGIEFRMDRALRANTFDAHRLLWLTTATGHQEALKQRLLEAYFTDGLNVADHQVLADCAADVGLDHDAIVRFLASDDGVVETRAELDEAREIGITAVPTYVFGGTWAVPGAQDSDTFALVLRRLGAKRAAADAAASGEVCADEACAVAASSDGFGPRPDEVGTV